MLRKAKRASQHYQIKDSDPSKWLSLSCYLAAELGLFRIANPGRHKFWLPEKREQLLDEIDEIKKTKPGMKTAEAAARLLKKDPEKYPGVDAKTLQNLHSIAKSCGPRP